MGRTDRLSQRRTAQNQWTDSSGRGYGNGSGKFQVVPDSEALVRSVLEANITRERSTFKGFKARLGRGYVHANQDRVCGLQSEVFPHLLSIQASKIYVSPFGNYGATLLQWFGLGHPTCLRIEDRSRSIVDNLNLDFEHDPLWIGSVPRFHYPRLCLEPMLSLKPPMQELEGCEDKESDADNKLRVFSDCRPIHPQPFFLQFMLSSSVRQNRINVSTDVRDRQQQAFSLALAILW